MLVCIAYKSFDLGITYSDKDTTGKTIDAHSEVLFKSHVEKIEKMNAGWDESLPFCQMKVEKKAGGFTLKALATKIDCSNCIIGHAYKQCKKTLCKLCCMKDALVLKCTAHGKKQGAAPAPAPEASTEV
jgi:hypothetical protein